MSFLSYFFLKKINSLSEPILSICSDMNVDVNVPVEDLLPILQKLHSTFEDLQTQLEQFKDAMGGGEDDIIKLLQKIQSEKETNFFYYYIALTLSIGLYSYSMSLD